MCEVGKTEEGVTKEERENGDSKRCECRRLGRS